jgi:hypothetical protein
MPVNNALTPEGSNALGAAFGYYPQLRRNRQFNDPSASVEMPLQFMRGRFAGTAGMPSDILNMFRSPNPMEVYGDVNYAPQQQVPYGSQELMQTLPLPPTSPAGQLAGNVGSFVPMTPAEALQVARVARQAALAGSKFGKQGLGMLGEEVNATLLGERPKSFFGAITPKPMYAVEPNTNILAQSVMKPKAEVSPLGFYSAVEQQALNIPRKQGTGASFLNDLSKGQDVKKYEIEAMGLEDFLKGKTNVTRQEVQDFIANNRINLQERVLSGRGEKSGVFSEFNPDKNQFIVYGNDLSLHGAFNTAQEADKFVNNYNAQIPYGPSRYDKYQLPGGENYREVLLTLPSKGKPELDIAQQQANNLSRQTADLMSEWKNLSEQMPGDPRVVALYQRVAESRKLRDQAESQVNDLKKQISEETYKSSHFEEPNILAHMRVNDRVDAEGKKMLLIEEVQSDWHQAGREKGYQNKSGQYGEKVSPEEYKRGVALQNQQRNQSEPLTPSEQAELNDIMGRHEASIVGGRVPDAPFKDTWHQLALKRAIKEAVDKGYDRIGLTTGAQQAERYNLSSHVQDLTLHGTGDNLRLSATAADGTHKVIDMQHVTPKTLPNYIGKEAAQKLLSQPEPNPNNPYAARNLFGADLQVGGEGMKKYYDEIYPNFLNKLGKKYGTQVGETYINANAKTQTKDQLAKELFGNTETYKNLPSEQKRKVDVMFMDMSKEEKIRYLDITPEMRDAVKKGQPLASITNNLANAMA